MFPNFFFPYFNYKKDFNNKSEAKYTLVKFRKQYFIVLEMVHF